MRRTIRGLLGLVAVVACTACSDSSSGPSSAITGSYALITINGTVLPFVIFFDQSVTFRVTAGEVTLSSNNTFSGSFTYQETLTAGQSTTVTETCNGTYAVNGNSVTFTETTSTTANCGGVYSGTWDGSNTLTVAFDVTLQAVFRK